MLIIDFINVGYGDAVLIRDTEEKITILVDSGDITIGRRLNSTRITAKAFLQKEGIKRIDLLVLTHLHLDHIGGLKKILDKVTVRECRVNFLPPEAFWGKQIPISIEFSHNSRRLIKAMNIFLEALLRMKRSGTLIELAKTGEDMWGKNLLLRTATASEKLLQKQDLIWTNTLSGNPDIEALHELNRFINDTSIRIHLTYKEHSAFLPGDCHANMWPGDQIIPCEIVKLPHHGHRGSMTKNNLDQMRPKYAVISVSNSRKDDCPAKEILSLLHENNVEVLFTDAVKRKGFLTEYHESVRFVW